LGFVFIWKIDIYFEKIAREMISTTILCINIYRDKIAILISIFLIVQF